MNIRVNRDRRTQAAVTSLIDIDNVGFGVGLEPANPLPAGVYECWLRWSVANRCWVIAVMNVPGHDNVEVHIGNSAKDTTLCLLVGLAREGDYITHSADAFELLWRRILAVLPHERVTIEYVDNYAGVSDGNAANA